MLWQFASASRTLERMSDAEEDPAGETHAQPPLSVEVLADLQAGLLSDADAADVPKRVRADPDARQSLQALNQVRRDVAEFGADAGSAPDAPPHVVADIQAALRSAGDPASGSAARRHAAHSTRPGMPGPRVVAAVAGVAAALAAVGVGTAALMMTPAPAPTPTTAQHITVSARPTVIPLSAAQILGLLDRTPDFGALSDAARRSSCLSGLGYPVSTQVLGAQPIDINGRPGVLLVLPGDTPDVLTAVAVGPNCSSADTGLLADTVVRRP